MLADELPTVLYCLLCFRQEGGKCLPDMGHIIPDFQRYINPGRLGSLGKPQGIVKEHLSCADLEE